MHGQHGIISAPNTEAQSPPIRKMLYLPPLAEGKPGVTEVQLRCLRPILNRPARVQLSACISSGGSRGWCR
jgi:hypothetical protein